MMKSISLFLIAGITCLLSACGDFQSPYLQAPVLKSLWTVPVNGAFQTFSNNGKLVGLVDWTDTLTLATFDPKQRKIIWKSQPHASLGLYKNFAAGDGVVYYMVPNENLEVYDIDTGKILESVPPPTGIVFN
jgi:hypothetical protein